ncbi:MAG TPA: NAD-dependent epimerase/dehydratase family protein [Candidatus Methylomirabilis sp.]|nr:NAD-dependent epimerase/dehydratase family protein [Candidatus Methylomirabilis sp.]
MTGGTGYVGSGIVRALVEAGHRVTGLVRSAEKEAVLRGLGATPVRGDLKDPPTYRGMAAEHDAAIHAGFEYSEKAVEADRIAIETLLAATKAGGGLRGVVYTSGVWVLGNTGDRPADEGASTAGAAPIVAWRPAHERLVLDAGRGTLATAVIRPGMVYGGKGGLVTQFFSSATKEGAAAYVGTGTNRWSLVHRDDLGQLYRLVVEKRARGVFHGVDGVPVAVADAARAASHAAGKGGATRSIPLEEARKQMGPVADALCLDQVVVTRRSAELGWKLKQDSFLDGVRPAFDEWRA